MKQFKIYLDMDGVLCNFNKKYEEMFGIFPTDVDRAQKHFNNNWQNFIESGAFKELEPHPGSDTLLKVVKALNCQVEILTSTGGTLYQEIVIAHKRHWLESHGIWYKPNFVNFRLKKAEYADEWSVLIDDTPDVIESFTSAGGIGILHNDIEETINTLTMHYNLYHLHDRVYTEADKLPVTVL